MIWEQQNAMDQGHPFSLGRSSDESSFFSKEFRFPTERQVGSWNAETVMDRFGTEGRSSLSRNKSVSLSPLKQFHVPGPNGVEPINLQQSYMIDNEYTNLTLEDHVMRLKNRSATLPSNDVQLGESIGTYSKFYKDEPYESVEEIEAQTIGNLLPDDDDLLSGVIDNIGYSYQINNRDDIDDDIFYSGGGLELETDGRIKANNNPGSVGEGVSNCRLGGLNGILAGEHPSRTLFVRNILSDVDDAELKALFEQYGDIRSLYTASKHRGFVMISYYDIRSARNALRALQNKPLWHRNLDIHYSIPKENLSDQDINQGTLVVFNLDSSVSNDELLRIFGIYGEIKEIRETPHKHHHKFVEFYDIRAAEAALTLNRCDIKGKKIKVEPSRSGSAKCLMQQSSSEVGQDELVGCNVDSSINSQTDYFGTNGRNNHEFEAASSFQIAIRAPVSPLEDTSFVGPSGASQTLSLPSRISPIINHENQSTIGDLNKSLTQLNLGYQGMPTFHPNSLPEYNNGLPEGTYNSSTMSAFGLNNIRTAESVDTKHLKKLTYGSLKAFGVSGSRSPSLHGHQDGWNVRSAFQHQVPSSIPWSCSSLFMNNIAARQNGLPKVSPHMRNTTLPLHHVGSAPTADTPLWDRQHPYPIDPTEFHSGSLGSMGFPASPQWHQLELASHNSFPHACGICLDSSISPAHAGISSSQQRCQLFHGRNHKVHPGSCDSPSDRIRSRRNDLSANQSDNRKQYELDIDRIMNGEDSRTTLMLKNIPNKYSAEMLLQAIDENHRRTYDFIYLPIDFKNNCNVGYAFINMTSPHLIVPFYQTFNGKKWEKFNSEKVASLAYARIQGKAALIAHFRNSSLMNEDKRCRPILFYSDGPNVGEQEAFPMGPNIRSRPGRSRAANGSEEQHQESPSTTTVDQEVSCDALGSPTDSTRDSE